jgi:(1->4)-alpha-D-glucan 1-alpha-D-glucosylmutase
LFTDYRPVTPTGSAADHVLAFDRGGAITVATRLPVGLDRRGGFGDTTLTLKGDYVDVLTDRQYSGPARANDLLSIYPAALLIRT